MQNPDTHSDGDDSVETKGDQVRQQMDTKSLEAIMGRFFTAVSWSGSE